jgi:DNA-binding FadR family transcriptional regulator
MRSIDSRKRRAGSGHKATRPTRAGVRRRARRLSLDAPRGHPRTSGDEHPRLAYGDGTYVSSLEPELLSQPFTFLLEARPALLSHLFEAQRVLEAACASLAAERITDEEVVELERLVPGDDAGAEELIDRDVELHTAIARATRSPILISLLGSIGSLGLQSRETSAAVPGQARQI